MPKRKVDLGHLMDAPTLSLDVAARLFSTVEEVEVDIIAASTAPDAAHRALKDLLRSAPDSPAMRDFLALYLAQVRHAIHHIEGATTRENTMSTVKTKYPDKYTKYYPTYNYMRDCHTWSMTKEESIAISEKADKCLDNGDLDGYIEWAKKIPLAPNMALMMRDDHGKEYLLEEGFNLADAEIVYGKDWLDNYMIDEDDGE